MSLLRAPITGRLAGALLVLSSIALVITSVYLTGDIPETANLATILFLNGFFVALFLYIDLQALVIELVVWGKKRKHKGNWKVPNEDLTTSPYLAATVDKFLANFIFFLALIISMLLGLIFASQDPNPELMTILVLVFGMVFLGLMVLRIRRDAIHFLTRLEIVWRYYSLLHDPNPDEKIVETIENLLSRQDWGQTRVAIKKRDQETYSRIKWLQEEGVEKLGNLLSLAVGNFSHLAIDKDGWQYVGSGYTISEFINSGLDEIEWKDSRQVQTTKSFEGASFADDLANFNTSYTKWHTSLGKLYEQIFNFWNRLLTELIPKIQSEEEETIHPQDYANAAARILLIRFGRNPDDFVSQEDTQKAKQIATWGWKIKGKAVDRADYLPQFLSSLKSELEPPNKVLLDATKEHHKEWEAIWEETAKLGKKAVTVWGELELEKRTSEIYGTLQAHFGEEPKPSQRENVI
ncbi:MAG: hypothetical protein ACE5OZ_26375 [Candidatus Heimdallarchaeota archaeon]